MPFPKGQGMRAASDVREGPVHGLAASAAAERLRQQSYVASAKLRLAGGSPEPHSHSRAVVEDSGGRVERGPLTSKASVTASNGEAGCLSIALPPADVQGWEQAYPTVLEVRRAAQVIARGALVDVRVVEAPVCGHAAYGVVSSATMLSPNLSSLLAFVWPADHRWCFASDVDPHWAGIGAEQVAIDRLVGDPGLDVVRVQPNEIPPRIADRVVRAVSRAVPLVGELRDESRAQAHTCAGGSDDYPAVESRQPVNAAGAPRLGTHRVGRRVACRRVDRRGAPSPCQRGASAATRRGRSIRLSEGVLGGAPVRLSSSRIRPRRRRVGFPTCERN